MDIEQAIGEELRARRRRKKISQEQLGFDAGVHRTLLGKRCNMKTMEIEIPRYDPDCKEEYDYSRPHKLTLQEVEGLRVIMGDPDDEDAPDVLIERAVGLWRIFVHPDRSDPLCIIEIRPGRAIVEDEWGQLLLERALH
jgi:transcriptional regulator with XRE-family HTH domain